MKVRLEFSISLIIACSLLLIVLGREYNNLSFTNNLGLQALLITYLFNLTSEMSSFIQSMAEIAKGMASVQRIYENLQIKNYEDDF